MGLRKGDNMKMKELVKALCYDDEPQYTPIQILDMWGIINNIYFCNAIGCSMNSETLKGSCDNCHDIVQQEMLLDFLVMLGVEI